MEELTKKQARFLKYIKTYMYKHKRAPSHKDLQDRFKFKSDNAPTHFLNVLVKKKYIKMKKDISRSIVIIRTGICPYCRRGGKIGNNKESMTIWANCRRGD